MEISKEKAKDLLAAYGSPLYVYDEKTLRARCREVKSLLPGMNFRINYSAKANSNLEFLKIVNEEGLDVDAMSPGEIFLEQKAGFTSDRIFYICNNVSAEEMKYAIDRDITVSVDSLSQLDLFGRTNPGGRVAVRFNPGVGAGHHEKVITAGKKTKFGVQADLAGEVKAILKKYGLRLAGINQHIGSLFLEEDKYIDGVKNLLKIAAGFEGLSFIDMGGGFGVPYKKEEKRLDLALLSRKLRPVLEEFLSSCGNKNLVFKSEPGRYVSAECGVLLGEAYSVKENYGVTYVGTDLGMNILMRPVLYDSYHEVSVVGKEKEPVSEKPVMIVGNICESGDILAKERLLPKIEEGDILAVANAGAYGFSMASNYNCRQLPAEVLKQEDGTYRLIRKRETLMDLVRNFVD